MIVLPRDRSGPKQELSFSRQLRDFTLEVISTAFLGEIDEDLMQLLRRDIPVVGESLASIPIRLPWPLNRTPLARLPALTFGRSMEARERVYKALEGVIKERRESSSPRGTGPGSETALDRLLAMQAAQREAGGPKEGETPIDDPFIIDNVSHLRERGGGGRDMPSPRA